jgi:hypothetical protein
VSLLRDEVRLFVEAGMLTVAQQQRIEDLLERDDHAPARALFGRYRNELEIDRFRSEGRLTDEQARVLRQMLRAELPILIAEPHLLRIQTVRDWNEDPSG